MASRLTFVLVVILGLFSISSSKATGFLYSADPSGPNSLLKDVPADVVFDDVDLRQLIAHNLGVLNENDSLLSSTKDLISKFGAKSILNQQKLNYLFFLESDNQGIEKNFFDKLDNKHKNVFFNLCADDATDRCILDLIYDNAQEKSLINILKKEAKKQDIEAFYYSSEPNTARSYFDQALSVLKNQEGNLMLIDNGKSEVFNLKTDVSKCVNNVLVNKFTVNSDERTITSLTDGNVITFEEGHQEAFDKFLGDICSVVTISKMIQKDSEPSLFTFYIDSLANLESLVETEKSKKLYQIWSIAYEQFLYNVMKKYGPQEITGQVFIMNTEEGLGKKYQNDVRNNEAEDLIIPKSMLQTTASSKTRKLQEGSTPTDTTGVIYQSVCFFFALALFWVCVEMFNMDIQKESVVYAKFIAGDFLRRDR